MAIIDNLHDLSNTVTAVVNRVLEVATNSTTTGQYYVGYSDVSDLIGQEDFLRYFELISNELRSREEVLDLDTADHEFDVVCGLAWCPNYEPLPDEDIEYGEEPLRPAPSMSRLSELGQKALVHIVSKPYLSKSLTEDLGISPAEIEYVRDHFSLAYSQYQDPAKLEPLAPMPVTNESYEDLIIAAEQQRLLAFSSGKYNGEKSAFQVCINLFGQELNDRHFPREPEALAILAEHFVKPLPTGTSYCGVTIYGKPALVLYHDVAQIPSEDQLSHAAAAMMSAQLQEIFLGTSARFSYNPGTGSDGRDEILAILPADTQPETVHAFERTLTRVMESLPFSRNVNWVKSQYNAFLSAVKDTLPNHHIVTPWVQAHPEQAALRACEELGRYMGRCQAELEQATAAHNYAKIERLASKFNVSKGSSLLPTLTRRGIYRADMDLGRRVQLFTNTDLSESFSLTKGQLLTAMKEMGYTADYPVMSFMSGYSPEQAREVQSVLQALPHPSLLQQIRSAEKQKNRANGTDTDKSQDRKKGEGREY